MSSLSLKEQQNELSKKVILETATTLMLDRGYIDTQMDEIALQVGISKATLYKHFHSKEELTLHLIIANIKQGRLKFEAMDTNSPAIQRLENILLTGIEHRGVIFGSAIRQLPDTILADPRFKEQLNQVEKSVADLIDEAKTTGDISQDIPTVIIVKLIGTLFRFDFNALIETNNLSPAEASDHIKTVLLNGILSK